MHTNPDSYWIKVNAECWVENHTETIKMVYDAKQEAFFAAIITHVTATTIKVKYFGAGLTTDEHLLKYVHQRDSGGQQQHVDNLADLAVINEAEMLKHLKVRFAGRKIFAAVGDALLITNPYVAVPELFSPAVMATYQHPTAQLPAHIYGVASNAFADIFESERNQSIVISGESGSGKTESTKFALNVLTSLSSAASAKDKMTKSTYISLEDQIQLCNPILESFGNAKTIRNDNSSRFGKLVTLLIGTSRTIEAAQFQSYLLEKSRVTQQTSEERNFHVFYALLKGLSDKELDTLGLKPYNEKLEVGKFRYLSANPKPTVEGIDDAQWYKSISASWRSLSFSAVEVQTILSFLASILLIGNIEFDESTLTNDLPCQMQPGGHKIAELLGVDQTQLERSLLFKTRNISTTTVIDSPLNRADCASQRDSIAREVYDCLFGWLLRRINAIMITHSQMTSSQQRKNHKLQILDIFGFEVLTHNSFEQMCINFANERLQQLFIQTIFKKDQAELKAEGLTEHINQISFLDNQNIIDLLEGYPMGIFFLLDENSQIAGTDETMANKIRQQYASHPKFSAPPLSKTKFIIRHTPRDVEYDVLGFKAKNKDEVGPAILKTMALSRNSIAVDIFQSKHATTTTATTTTATTKAKTLGAKFRQSIKELIEELSKSKLSFVRCLKPNETKSKDAFVNIFVLQQLRYLGIADSIRIRKEGFPYRRTYQEFYKRYGEMDVQKHSYPKLVELGADFQKLVRNMSIWKQVGGGGKQVGFLFGKNILFMRLMVRNQIELQYAIAVKLKHQMATKIQRSYFRHRQLLRFRTTRRGIVRIQGLFRVRRHYKLFQLKRRKATLIQRWWRYTLYNRTRKYIRQNAIVLQTYIKRLARLKAFIHTRDSLLTLQRFLHSKLALLARRKYKSFKMFFVRTIFDRFWQLIRRRAIINIQRHVRGFLVRSLHHNRVTHLRTFRRTYHKRRALVALQCVVRGFLVRRRIQRMRRAATHIQGRMRTHWLSALFQRIRWAVLLIQVAYRRHTTKNTSQRTALRQYLQENDLQQYKMKESGTFTTLQREFCRSVFPLSRQSKAWVYPLLISVEVTTDLSDVYGNNNFTASLFDFVRQRSNEGTTVMDIQCGDAHILASCANQNLYAWGLNDYYQLGKVTTRATHTMQQYGTQLINNTPNTTTPKKQDYVIVTSGTRIKSISAGANHNLCLNYNNELFAFGKDSRGEIGLPAMKNIAQPSQITLGAVRSAYTLALSQGSQSLLVTTQGVAYHNHNKHNTLRELPIKTQIMSAALGVDFAALLSHTGVLYTTTPTLEALPQKHFHNEKIVQVAAGQRHIIACTSVGKVFTWGWGTKGQLGHGNFRSSDVPQCVQLPKLQRPIQINAGLTSSIILTDTKKIFWWGSNAILTYQNLPTPLQIDTLIDVNENYPLKIESSWSRTAGIMYLKMADMSGILIPGLNKQKVAHQIALKWASANQQDVPYIDSFAKYFQNDVMQAPHHSKDPTFRTAPLIEQLSQPHHPHTPRSSKEIKHEIMYMEHFERWDNAQTINPQFVVDEDELLLTSNEVSPQKELEKVQRRVSKSPIFHPVHITPRDSLNTNHHEHDLNQSREREHMDRELKEIQLKKEIEFKEREYRLMEKEQQLMDKERDHRIKNREHPHVQQPVTKHQQPPQFQPLKHQYYPHDRDHSPQFQPLVDPKSHRNLSAITVQPAKKNREHTPNRLVFRANDEVQSHHHVPPHPAQQHEQTQHQVQLHHQVPAHHQVLAHHQVPSHHQVPAPHHVPLDLDALERLQRKLSFTKMKMETLLKIPKQQWNQADHQFMMSMQDKQIRSQLQQLK